MTGEQFINRLKLIQKINDIRWGVTGDALDPDEVKIIVVADDEEIAVSFQRHINDPRYFLTDAFMQNASVALLVNKCMQQIGDSFRTNAYDDLVKAVNYSILRITEWKQTG